MMLNFLVSLCNPDFLYVSLLFSQVLHILYMERLETIMIPMTSVNVVILV